jgi:hypothetical protein
VADGTNSDSVAYFIGKTSASEYIIKVGPLYTIAGQVNYAGHKQGVLRLDFYETQAPDFSRSEWLQGIIASGGASPWTYSLDLPAQKCYFINAYLDLTNDGWDMDDPNGWYHEGDVWRSPVFLYNDQSAIDITLSSDPAIPLSAINLLLFPRD